MESGEGIESLNQIHKSLDRYHGSWNPVKELKVSDRQPVHYHVPQDLVESGEGIESSDRTAHRLGMGTWNPVKELKVYLRHSSRYRALY